MFIIEKSTKPLFFWLRPYSVRPACALHARRQTMSHRRYSLVLVSLIVHCSPANTKTIQSEITN